MNDSEFGIAKFAYTKEKCERIYGYLKANSGNVCRVFDCIWSEGLFRDQHDQAPTILALIGKVERARKNVGDNFETIWNDMHSDEHFVTVCPPK